MEKTMSSKCQWMATNRIKTRPPFKNLFPVDEKTFNAVAEDMKVRGYDQSQPIIVWKEKLDASKNDALVIDGHTRLFAAKRIGLSPVYIARVSFPDEQEALHYAIHNQRDRRNMTDADLLSCIKAVDKRRSRGGDRKSEEAKSKGASQPIDSSAQETAKIVGTSESKVKKARTILDHADDTIKQEVMDGEKSIHKAAKETRESHEEDHRAEVYKKFHSAVGTLTRIIYKAKCSLEPISSQAIFFAINSIRGTAIKEIDGTEDKIMMIEDVGWLMANNCQDLHEIKPAIKRYLKTPPRDEEKAKAVEHFMSWLKAWEKEASSILSKVKEQTLTG